MTRQLPYDELPDAERRALKLRAILVGTLVLLGAWFLVDRAQSQQDERIDRSRDKWNCILDPEHHECD